MADNSTPSAIRESDYESLLSTLTETDRGRSFLDEYLRRHQKPDTQVVLEAIGRLEKAMVREKTVPSIDRIRLDIADMQEAIERTKREIANIKHEADDGNRFSEASNELDAIVTKTEAATQEILAAAESIQEHGWNLREAGAEETACDEIDARATEIFMACSFQDLTGQRTQKIVQVLQYLESRINMMISIWGIDDLEAKDIELRKDLRPDAHLLNGPQLEGRGVNQDAVDKLFGKDCDAAEAHLSSVDETNMTSAPDADGKATGGDDVTDVTEEDIASAGFAGETAGADEIDALFAETPSKPDSADANDTPTDNSDVEDAFMDDAALTNDAADTDEPAESEEPAEFEKADTTDGDDDVIWTESGAPEQDGFEMITGDADVFAVDVLDAEPRPTEAADVSGLTVLDGVSEADLDAADVFDRADVERGATEDEHAWRADTQAASASANDGDDDPLDMLSDGEKQTLFS